MLPEPLPNDSATPQRVLPVRQDVCSRASILRLLQRAGPRAAQQQRSTRWPRSEIPLEAGLITNRLRTREARCASRPGKRRRLIIIWRAWSPPYRLFGFSLEVRVHQREVAQRNRGERMAAREIDLTPNRSNSSLPTTAVIRRR
jgi:hypothetical protein